MLKAIKQKSKNGLNFFNLKDICKGKEKKALKVQLNDLYVVIVVSTGVIDGSLHDLDLSKIECCIL